MRAIEKVLHPSLLSLDRLKPHMRKMKIEMSKKLVASKMEIKGVLSERSVRAHRNLTVKESLADGEASVLIPLKCVTQFLRD